MVGCGLSAFHSGAKLVGLAGSLGWSAATLVPLAERRSAHRHKTSSKTAKSTATNFQCPPGLHDYPMVSGENLSSLDGIGRVEQV